MLHQVGEPGSALGVVIAADLVEHQERHVARSLDGTDPHRQTVVERELPGGAAGVGSAASRHRGAGELPEDLPLTHHGERESREWVIEEEGPGRLVVGVAGAGVAADGIVAGDRGPADGRVPGERTAATGDVPADRQSARRPPADRSAAERIDASAKPADSQDTQPEAAECDQAQRQPAEAHDAEGTAAQCDQSAGRRADRQQDASGVVADRDPAASDPPPAVGGGRAEGLPFARRHRRRRG